MARKMILLGDAVSAAKAGDIGLVDEVVEPGQAAVSAMELAQRIASLPAVAVRAIKKSMNTGLTQGMQAGSKFDIDLIADVFASHDARAGVAAMLAPREPTFLHR